MKWANPRRLPLFERIPVRWRIAVTTAGLTLLILVIFALVLGQVVGNRIRSDFRDELRSAAGSLAAETKIYTAPSGQQVVDTLPFRSQVGPLALQQGVEGIPQRLDGGALGRAELGEPA